MQNPDVACAHACRAGWPRRSTSCWAGTIRTIPHCCAHHRARRWLLFVAGDPARLWHPAVAVVGSRIAERRRPRQRRMIRSRAGRRPAWPSPAAWPRASIPPRMKARSPQAAQTIAVLGTGPDVPIRAPTPRLHARIAPAARWSANIRPARGARRGEFPEPQPHHRRTRAGHAGDRGRPAFRRADHRAHGDRCGRDVFAVPGSIHNPGARLPSPDPRRRGTRSRAPMR